MSCQYINECPSASGWCSGLKHDFSRCVTFLVSAANNARNENAMLRAQHCTDKDRIAALEAENARLQASGKEVAVGKKTS